MLKMQFVSVFPNETKIVNLGEVLIMSGELGGVM